jgi:hypothetical protein
MLQRIQTIFLALAAGAVFATISLPFATAPQPIETSALFADSVYDVNDHLVLLICFAVGGALALASIFLFKNRPLQMRLSLLAFFAVLGGLVFGIVLLVLDRGSLDQAALALGTGSPLVALVFLLLARRAIQKDEKLVRSMDRLR